MIPEVKIEVTRTNHLKFQVPRYQNKNVAKTKNFCLSVVVCRLKRQGRGAHFVPENCHCSPGEHLRAPVFPAAEEPPKIGASHFHGAP